MTKNSDAFSLIKLLVCIPTFLLLGCGTIGAQTPVNGDDPQAGINATFQPVDPDLQAPFYTLEELEQLVGPFALQPDDLLAIILPASTYPLEIVLAARFLDQLETDNSLQPDESWDESVVALLNYPEILRMMNERIELTWQLGEAVISQQNDVLTAIETFRNRALTAGNLASDEYQSVVVTEDSIEIKPVDERVVYVPYYVVEEVIVEQPVPVYHYYPTPRPVYYYPYPAGYRFSSGYFWGVMTAFSIHWSDYYLHVYHPSYHYHPYHGRSYFHGYHYRRPSIFTFNRLYVNNSIRQVRDRNRYGSYWRPQRHSSSRPNDIRYLNYYRADARGRDRLNQSLRNSGSFGEYRNGTVRSSLSAVSSRSRLNSSTRQARVGRENSRGRDANALGSALRSNTTANTSRDLDRNLNRSTTTSRQPRERARTSSSNRQQSIVNRSTTRRQGNGITVTDRRNSSNAMSALRNRVERVSPSSRRSTQNTNSNSDRRTAVRSSSRQQSLQSPTRVRQAPPNRSSATPQRNQRSTRPVERRQEIRQPQQRSQRAMPQPATQRQQILQPRRSPSSAAPSRPAPIRSATNRNRRENLREP